ncbi:MAG: helix-turn-helix domain-containing protein [Nannocystaceae bacterium]
MKKRDNDDLEPRGALLGPDADAFRITRHRPGPALAPFVRHYYFIRWDLRGRPPHHQSTLTLPAVNIVVEGPRDSVSGVITRRFDRVLAGQGAVYGCLFRPAGFSPFWRRPLHLLVDRSLPIAEVLAGDPAALRAGGDDAAMIAAFEALLLAAAPIRDPEAEEVDRWAALVEADPTIGRAELLAERLGLGLRTIQRALRRHVGVGPKVLIRRHRLLEASHRLSRGEAIDHAALALALGYADQSHFIRDFSAVVGSSPARYRRLLAARSDPRGGLFGQGPRDMP